MVPSQLGKQLLMVSFISSQQLLVAPFKLSQQLTTPFKLSQQLQTASIQSSKQLLMVIFQSISLSLRQSHQLLMGLLLSSRQLLMVPLESNVGMHLLVCAVQVCNLCGNQKHYFDQIFLYKENVMLDCKFKMPRNFNISIF